MFVYLSLPKDSRLSSPRLAWVMFEGGTHSKECSANRFRCLDGMFWIPAGTQTQHNS